MQKIELIYFEGCPNVQTARNSLSQALKMAEKKTEWTEWDVNDSECPEYARPYGSPTILIDGKDVYGEAPTFGASCRIYTHGDSETSNSPKAIDIYNQLK